MTLIKLPKRSICPLSIDAEQRREFQAVGERIIPRCPSRAISGSRRNAQIIKRKIMLLIEADGGLRSIFFPVKQPEKLPIIFPIPSGVAYVHEALVLDFSRNVTQCWERDRKSTRLNSSHEWISYAVFCLKKKKKTK